MKHTVTISFDDETRETEMVAGGKRYTFTLATMTTTREPVDDDDAMEGALEKGDAAYRILKPGPVLDFHFNGTILSEEPTPAR